MHRSKICIKCKEEMVLGEFYKHAKMADGHLNKCKSCCRRDAGKRRIENIDKVRAYDRERGKNPKRAIAAAEISARWRTEDKRRMAAHNAVTRALRKGLLERKPCERCLAEKSYAHHESYSEDQRLVVVWLCQSHHKERHKEMALLGIEP